MKPEFFIARRFSFDKEGKKLMSRSIVRISVFSISLSIAVMIIALAVVTGFKKGISNKVVGFGSHIQILNFDSNNSLESIPISSEQDFLQSIRDLPGVEHIQVFATKPGIIKAEKENQAVFVKGVSSDYDWTFFSRNLVKGNTLRINDSVNTNDIMISVKLANLLKLDVGDEIAMFFFNERPRSRRFKISGLFATSLDEFDKQFILADIKHIQRLYNWNEDQISGFEILIDDFRHLEDLTHLIRNIAGYSFLADGSRLRILSIEEKYPQIFQWLGLLDMNVIVILIIMVIVAVINMISGLIILILDRTSAIGLLKAVGASNRTVKKIFLYQASYLIIKGLILGNVIAWVICFIQDKYQLLKLNQASYFIDYVPVNLTPAIVVLTNIGSLVVILLSMLLPALVILKIDPVKTLRYS